jgi:hypothetical protein
VSELIRAALDLDALAEDRVPAQRVGRIVDERRHRVKSGLARFDDDQNRPRRVVAADAIEPI